MLNANEVLKLYSVNNESKKKFKFRKSKNCRLDKETKINQTKVSEHASTEKTWNQLLFCSDFLLHNHHHKEINLIHGYMKEEKMETVYL